MNKGNLLTLSLVLLLSSCASTHEIQSGSCQRSTLVTGQEKKSSIEIRNIGFLNTKIKLKDVLLAKGVMCEGLRIGKIEIKDRFADSLINLIPFMTSHTLVIEIISKK